MIKFRPKLQKAQGISVYYFKQEYKHKELSIEKLFDDDTMSVHLKENVVPMAKKENLDMWNL